MYWPLSPICLSKERVHGGCTCQLFYEDSQASQDASEQNWWDSCTGIEIGSIVEGSDVEVGPEFLSFPFTEDDLDRTVKGIDDEASFYWERDNTTYYTVRKADGEVELWCQWTEFADNPTGTWDDDDQESLQLAIKAHKALWDPEANKLAKNGSRMTSYEAMIPIEGTELFVREEPTPDYTY